MSGRERTMMLMGPERLELRETPTPVPGPGELVLRIDAATTCGTDLKVWMRGGHPRMLEVPAPFGHEMSGTVVDVGDGVEGWSPGDPVVAANSASCGRCLPCRRGRENLCTDLRYLNGAFGTALLVPRRFVERSLYRRPHGVAPELAALAEPLACVLHGLEVAPPPEHGTTVVYGAGPIGLLFVAALADRGLAVVAADPEPDRLAVARRLGATTVQLGAGSPVEAVREVADEVPVAVDATGRPQGWEQAIASVDDGGTALLFGGCAPGTAVTLDAGRVHYGEITVAGAYHHRPRTFRSALQRIAGGLDLRPLLTEERPLEELGEALRGMRERRVLKAVIRPGAAQ